MRHSLRLRLLLILVTVPLLALVSVAIAARVSSDSTVASRLRFQIVPVQRAGGGPTGINEADDIPVFTTEIDFESNSQPVVFDTGTGQAYTIQAERGFIEAYRAERRDTLEAINQQVSIAAIAVALAAVVIAFWLSRRIVRPVEDLTAAARRLESGDLAQRVEVSSSDEIGVLGNAFNAMAESIQRNVSLRKQMASDVAHELRTPLNNISGYLEAISDGVVEPTPSVVTSLQEEAELLVRLVADLEQLTNADAGHTSLLEERLSLAEVAERAIALVATRARSRGIIIESSFAHASTVVGDVARLGQVVRNLLENAVTHTPDGGVVRLTIAPSPSGVRLEVSDTGPGIAAEHLPFIFERFYRADPSRTRATGGAGLGLAIVRQLVEAHGGSVSARNGAAGGAVFTVELPAEAPIRASATAIPGSALPSVS